MKLKGTAFLLIFLFIGVSLPPRGLTSSTMNTPYVYLHKTLNRFRKNTCVLSQLARATVYVE